MIDIDRFKNINDTLGHGMGDALLKLVGARLKTCIRDCDTLARWGGDEFVLLLPGVQDGGSAVIVGERCLTALKQPFVVEDQDLHITASIGISISVGLEHRVGDAAAECRRRDVQGQGARRRLPDDVQPGHERRRAQPPVDGERAVPRDREEGAAAALPAADLGQDRATRRRRGSAALESPRIRHGRARAVHPDRGRDGTDRRDRRMGVAHGMHANEMPGTHAGCRGSHCRSISPAGSFARRTWRARSGRCSRRPASLRKASSWS